MRELTRSINNVTFNADEWKAALFVLCACALADSPRMRIRRFNRQSGQTADLGSEDRAKKGVKHVICIEKKKVRDRWKTRLWMYV